MTPTPYLDILLLSLVVIWIVDVSGFTQSWMDALSRWLDRQIRPVKPFACSLCMTWWTGLAYALITRNLSIPIVAFCALMAYLSFPISQLMIFIHSTLMQWMSRR